MISCSIWLPAEARWADGEVFGFGAEIVLQTVYAVYQINWSSFQQASGALDEGAVIVHQAQGGFSGDRFDAPYARRRRASR